jgi:hypothetical protein
LILRYAFPQTEKILKPEKLLKNRRERRENQTRGGEKPECT